MNAGNQEPPAAARQTMHIPGEDAVLLEEYGGSRPFASIDFGALAHLETVLRHQAAPTAPPIRAEAGERDWTTVPGGAAVRLFLIHADGLLIGRAIAQVGIGEQRTAVGYFDIAVHPAQRRRRHGSRLLTAVARFLVREGAAQAVVETSSQQVDGEQFLLSVGAQLSLTYFVSQVMLRAGTEAARVSDARPSGLGADPVLDFWIGAPEGERLDEVTGLCEWMSDAPHGQVLAGARRRLSATVRREAERHHALGYLQLSALARLGQDGPAIGYTEATIRPDDPTTLVQHTTVVLPQARGHGVARWLVCSFHERVMGVRPHVVRARTEVAEFNTPMRRVNARLGYQDIDVRKEWILEDATLYRWAVPR